MTTFLHNHRKKKTFFTQSQKKGDLFYTITEKRRPFLHNHRRRPFLHNHRNKRDNIKKVVLFISTSIIFQLYKHGKEKTFVKFYEKTQSENY